MFSNFIYFIAAILIYSSYPGNELTNYEKSFFDLVCPLIATAFFYFMEYFYFIRLTIQADKISKETADYRFTRASGFFSIVLLLLYASLIYIGNLPACLPSLVLNQPFATARFLPMLFLFVMMITAHWMVSYMAYKKIYEDSGDAVHYVASGLMFAVPVIVPWFFVSLAIDIISVLPFHDFKKWLASMEGELVFFIVLVFAMSFAAPFLVKAAWRCRPLDSEEHLAVIDEICRKAGIKFRAILEWPLKGGNAVTAGVMGAYSRFRYLMITPALLRNMSTEELGAVVAHEVGHVKHRHMMLYLVILGFFSFTSIMAGPSIEEIIIFSGMFPLNSEVISTDRFLSFLPALFPVLLFIFYIRFVFGYFMRNFERQADAYAVGLAGSAQPMIKAFYKIVWLTGQNPEKPSWHHFSIRQRIDFILECEKSEDAIKKHSRKTVISLVVYFMVMGCTVSASFFYEHSDIKSYYLKKYLTGISTPDVKPFEINQAIGDYYYLKANMEKAAVYYEYAKSENPGNAEILNSLAWVYATADRIPPRNPEKAVELASLAVRIKPDSSQIWDTLAESFYAASDYSGAVSAGEKALYLAEGKDKKYYEGQLKKFREK